MDPDSTNVTDDPKFQCGFLCGYLLGTGQLDANTIRDLPQFSHTFTRPARPYRIPGELIDQDLEVRPTRLRARPYQVPGELIDQDLEVRPTRLRARPYKIPTNQIRQDFAGRLAVRAERTNSSSTTPTGSKRGSHHLDAASGPGPDAKRRRLKKRYMEHRSTLGARTKASAKVPAASASVKKPTTTASAKVPAASASVKIPTTTASAKVPAATPTASVKVTVPAATASVKIPTTPISTKMPRCEPKHQPTASVKIPTAPVSTKVPKCEPKYQPKCESEDETTVHLHPPTPIIPLRRSRRPPTVHRPTL
ncbi:hypothetical protein DFP73DRAFT_377306 [Morchella snyderi]|nr:hypothetical protein DFP73DRAFT_377306 [Morchella snyderi]